MVSGGLIVYYLVVAPRTWPGLLKTLREHPDPKVRIAAAEALWTVFPHRDESIQALRRASLDDPDEEVRNVANAALNGYS